MVNKSNIVKAIDEIITFIKENSQPHNFSNPVPYSNYQPPSPYPHQYYSSYPYTTQYPDQNSSTYQSYSYPSQIPPAQSLQPYKPLSDPSYYEETTFCDSRSDQSFDPASPRQLPQPKNELAHQYACHYNEILKYPYSYLYNYFMQNYATKMPSESETIPKEASTEQKP